MWLRMPLIPVAIAFGAGIAAAGRMPLVAVWSVSLAALALALLALALGRPIVATALLLLDVAAIGALRAAPLPLADDHVAQLALPRSATLTGRIDGEPTEFAWD